MFDIFEKLRDFESQAGQDYADWNSLQERLDKDQKKRFPWIGLTTTVFLVLIPFTIFELYFNTDFGSHSTIAATENNGSATTQLELSSGYESNDQGLETPSETITDRSPQLSIAQTTILNDETPKELTGNTSPEMVDLGAEISPMPLTVLDTESNPSLILGQDYNIPEEEENHPNSFDVEVGLKTSISNAIANSPSPTSWGAGVFANAKYNVGKHLSFGIGAGIQSAFNQNLNYSYISESRSFFERSDRVVNINTKQTYYANFNFTTSLRWKKRFETGVGIYYNYVFQTVSDVRESGTGSFASIDEQMTNQTGYGDLLNNHEFGLRISQTVMLKQNWGLTLSFSRGLTNRINKAYFPDVDNKRTQLSLMIFKRIGL